MIYRVEIISQRFDELTDSRASNEGGGGGGGGPPSNSSVDKRLSEIEKQVYIPYSSPSLITTSNMIRCVLDWTYDNELGYCEEYPTEIT